MTHINQPPTSNPPAPPSPSSPIKNKIKEETVSPVMPILSSWWDVVMGKPPLKLDDTPQQVDPTGKVKVDVVKGPQRICYVCGKATIEIEKIKDRMKETTAILEGIVDGNLYIDMIIKTLEKQIKLNNELLGEL